jgi:cell shape-determining protein MreC
MKNFSLNTKGNYPRNSKTIENKRVYLVWIIIVFILLFSAKDIIATVTSFVVTPLYMARHYIETGTGNVPVFIRSRIDLENQISDLQKELSESRGMGTTLSSVMKENEELRSQLNASATPRIAAGVISRPPYSPYDTFVLDKGSDDGIVQYAPVYHGVSRVIGYVREVFSQSAFVTLFSSAGVESSAYVFGPNIFTHIYGEGGGVMRLSIPQGILVEKGNVVVLPSIEGGVLGEVFDVQSVPTEPEQHAYVSFDAPLTSIRLVSVGMRKMEKVSFTVAEQNVSDAERALFLVDVPLEYQLASTTASSTVPETISP